MRYNLLLAWAIIATIIISPFLLAAMVLVGIANVIGGIVVLDREIVAETWERMKGVWYLID